MKKVLGFSIAWAAVLFAACDNKENSYNFAQIVYPGEQPASVFADQTVDTLRFLTTYDWSISESVDWLHIDADSTAGVVPGGFFMSGKVKVMFDVNNTGETRTGIVNLHANGETLGGVYVQYAYLDVRRPVINREGGYVLRDTANQVRDSIEFRTYSDGWTLAFDGQAPTWVRLADGAPATGRAGKYIVPYVLEKNPTSEERTAVLRLTSAGVSADIQIKQEGRPADEE